MNTDLSPLYRTLVGFDRISNMMDKAMRLDAAPGYPPFNVEQTGEDSYRVELAVAGFTQDELNIEFKENTLFVTGRKEAAEGERKFLHRGIAERGFERRFSLADHVKVVDAKLENGLLRIELVREVPEQLKPRTIAINGQAKDAPQTAKVVSEAA